MYCRESMPIDRRMKRKFMIVRLEYWECLKSKINKSIMLVELEFKVSVEESEIGPDTLEKISLLEKKLVKEELLTLKTHLIHKILERLELQRKTKEEYQMVACFRHPRSEETHLWVAIASLI